MQIFWIQIEVCVILSVTAILDGLRTSKVKIARLIYGHLPIFLNLGKKCQNENNVNKSYKLAYDAVDDQLTCAKLCVFSFVAKIMEPCLVAYPTDNFLLSRFICFSQKDYGNRCKVKNKVLSESNAAINLKKN